MSGHQRYVVVTADQRGSRRSGDLVPAVIGALEAVRPYRSFERTAGDEVQGVLADAGSTLAVLERLVRPGAWSVGVGIGRIEEPLPASTRAGRGAAFVHARTAVEAAKNNPARIVVVGDDAVGDTRLETVLMLWASLLRRRTPGGWEVADLLAEGRSREDVATRLGITQSAVSQRVSAAAVQESARGRTLAVEMLTALLEDAP